MCNFLTVVIFDLVITDQVNGQQQLPAQVKACQTKEGASEADVQEMMQGKLASTHKAKCLHACMMEEMGILRNGRQSPETAIAVAKQHSNNNPTIVKQTTDVTRECAAVSHPDRCEMAFKMIQCSIEVAKKHGFGPKK